MTGSAPAWSDEPESVFNWTQETADFRAFTAGPPGILHVVGDGPHYVHWFLENARTHEGKPVTCVIDPHAGARSPFEVLRRIATGLGLDPSPVVATPPTVSVIKDIDAGGDVSIEDVRVDVRYQIATDEWIEVDRLQELILDHLDSGVDLQGFVLSFPACEEHDLPMRRTLYRSVWTRVGVTLVKKGAHVVFQYPMSIERHRDAIPPAANQRITLPERLLTGVSTEIADHAMSKGWSDSPDAAVLFAETVLHLSSTVEELYANVAVIEYERRSTP
ncbi:hypothetical protein [Curtobacterium pusillum]|uniref:hypothetical protein n=1 Tax=Curtobacterium pusillum TaxID=69373 RepID=UPI0011A5A134|nr:hypothetical protein [Curtobacterium pusillum]